jgi:hypothetical protein
MPDKKAVGDWLRQIIDILNREWDPIGVMSLDAEWPDDEYQGYAGKLATMLRAQATDEELMSYIEWAEIENMGLSPPFDHERARRVIAALQALAMPTQR